MLYPLSYEGGDAFPQVRPYFFASPDPCPSIPCPRRAQSIGEQRFRQHLVMIRIVASAIVNLLVTVLVMSRKRRLLDTGARRVTPDARRRG
jgi:hypothetical protein